MNKAKQRNKHLSPRLLERHIDPRAKVVGFLDIVKTNLIAAGVGAKRRSRELDRARRAAKALVGVVQALNRAGFWASLTVTRENRPQTAEMIREERSELLQDAREQLVESEVTRAEIVGVIDTLHEVVLSMNTHFSVAGVAGQDEPDDTWALDRFTCAALLPVVAQGLDNFWEGLRRTLAEHE